MRVTANQRQRLVLAAVLGLALILRLVHLFEVRDTPFFLHLHTDAFLYDDWAQRIASGDWLSRAQPVFYLAPAYPYFLALVYALVGPSTLAAVIIQVGLSTASVGMIVQLGRRLFEPWVGWVAGVLAATYAMYVFYASLILAETLVVFLNLAMLCALVEGVRRGSRRWLFLSGMCLGLSAQARGSILVFAVFAALAILVAGRTRGPRAWFPELCAFGAALALSIAPSLAHNAWIGGDRVLLTSNSGANFYIGNNDAADGIFMSPARYKDRVLGLSVDDQNLNFPEIARRELGREALAPSEVSAFWTREAWRQIAIDPARWLRLLGAKLHYLVNAYEVPNNRNLYFSRRFSRLLQLPLVSFGAILPFAVVGMALGLRRWRHSLPLYGYVLSLVFTLLAYFVNGRYRLALTPVLIVFAALAAVEIARALLARRWMLLLVCALALAPLYALVYSEVDQISFRSDFVNLGIAYQSLGDPARAIEQYDAALAIAPRFYPAWSLKGQALTTLGRREEATSALRSALGLALASGDAVEAARIRTALAALERARPE